VDDELTRRLAHARSHIDSGFDQPEVERALTGLERRITRRRRVKQASVGVAMVALSLLAWLSHAAPPGSSLATWSGGTAAPQVVQTRDGSLATLVGSDTQLQLQHDGENEVALSLTRGTGHFEVSKRASRRYRVRAGAVEVQVLGTVFDVERRGARAEVRVARGAVQVTWPGGQTVLHAGESDWFPRNQASPPAAAPSAASSAVMEPSAQPSLAPSSQQLGRFEPRLEHASGQTKRGSNVREAWRTLARAGKHREAFRSLDRAPVEDLDGLLLAADAARLSHHPREAARYLERLVERYPETAPARLAAFTLGGLMLHELASPARAARSFARAYELDPEGPLAQDALAREAQAHARAGRPELAAKVAERYLARFPGGARRSELERYLVTD
jgi:transmembrane sensor